MDQDKELCTIKLMRRPDGSIKAVLNGHTADAFTKSDELSDKIKTVAFWMEAGAVDLHRVVRNYETD